MTTPRPAAVVVLAAGAGTRMRSDLPKVLHSIGGRTLLGHALVAARELEPERIAVVVRHGRDRVAEHALATEPQALIVDQDEIPGTGRAVQCALGALDGAASGADGAGPAQVEGAVVVIAGDVPLLDGGTLGQLLATHHADRNAVTVLTTEVADPSGYGRIVREVGTGDVLAVVEERDATEEQRAIAEVNTSTYVFDAAVLRSALGRIGRDNAQGEVYLTDVLAIARADGGAVRAVRADDPVTVEGVNDRAQLAALGAELNRRIVQDWMVAGVTVIDPATTWVDVTVELEPDVTLEPGVQLRGTTVVRSGATVGPDSTLTDVEVGAGATVIRSHATSATIGAGATVGPFSYLRPGTVLGASGTIGAFVERNSVSIGVGSTLPGLAPAESTEGEDQR